MIGHRLGDAQRYTNETLTIFRAECGCGLAVYGRRLPHLWVRHEEHLAAVREQSRRPSGWEAS